MTKKDRDAQAKERFKALKDAGDELPPFIRVDQWIYKLSAKKDGYIEHEPL